MRERWAVVFCFAVISLTTTMAAQDKPLAEVTGAYQFNHLKLSADGGSASTNVPDGFDASVNVPITRWIGAVGDIGRVWKNQSATIETVHATASSSIWTYGGGPQLTYRTSYVQPFVRFILGDAYSSGSVSASGFSGLFNLSASAGVNTLFIAPGGGADFRITHNVWLHGGADYFRTGKDGVTASGVRAFGGITFVFGGRSQERTHDRPAPTAQTPRPSAPPPTQREARTEIQIDTLGVTVATGRNGGAEITEESPNGVAALAGFHSGDVINAVDGKVVKTPMELAAQLATRQSHEKVRLGYLIHGQWQTEMVVALAQ